MKLKNFTLPSNTCSLLSIHCPPNTGDIRETTIKMVCDHSLSDVEVEFDQIKEVSHCVYEAFAFSGLPCDKVRTFGLSWIRLNVDLVLNSL